MAGDGMISLTRKQADMFSFIKTFVAERGVGPSYDEMAAAAGIKSKSGVHRIVTALEERQLIRRIPNRARTIEIISPGSDALGFLAPDVLSVVERTARENDMLPETVVAQIVLQWARSALTTKSRRRASYVENERFPFVANVPVSA